MKTILIPFDSSATAKNTIDYVCNLLEQVKAEKIYILQSLEVSVFDQISRGGNDELFDERNSVELVLKDIAERIQECSGAETIVKYAVSEFPLLRAVHSAINELEPDVIIAGSDSNDEESLIGDEIISISKTSPVPVLVIPSGARFEPIESLLVPCNFKDLSSLSLLEGLKTIEGPNEVTLELLNVDASQSYLDRKEEIENNISELLKDHHYRLNYSHQGNIVEGILEFAAENNVQIVIALPGKHSFFYRLTHSSITQALTQNSAKPVLLLKDIEE